ncbi:hypothetical protein GOP47_0013028 [Adiantum capillus-veneris]|uniref:Uncharacterized protein n=1 Tax=Adiantum capillus-veneris TaxID=13818 RepID=A0A9D4ZG92_ADICA|nr:hypothetical protein GOP47_0013028 [Adiantum capillus-veneris]
MNTLYDQFQRCMRHPHQRIVGVCSSCLQERLTSLIHPPSSPIEVRQSYNAQERAHAPTSNNHISVAHEQERHVHANSHVTRPNLPSKAIIDGTTDSLPRTSNVRDTRTQDKASLRRHSGSASTSTAPQAHDDARNSHVEGAKLGHGHHPSSSDFASEARPKNHQNGHIDKQGRNPGPASSSTSPSIEKKNRAAPAQKRQTHEVSFSEGDKKKGSSWFSLPKSKSSTQALDNPGLSKHVSKSPRHNAAPTGTNFDACRHRQTPDLEAIAEMSTSDVSSNIQRHINREAGTPASWLSVLFHRRKWSRSRSNLSNSSGGSVQNAISDTNGNGGISSSESNHRQSSVEAGRLSWDGARPNFKQLLKRIETRSKLPQVPASDFSPSSQSYVDYTMKEYNGNGREVTNQAAYLQKSKSVASARSSISVEMPKDLMQSSFSPRLHQGQSNVMVGLDYDTYIDDDRNLRRSRSWGRTWNRALSPLWGSRSHRHKVTQLDASASAHQRDYSRHARTPVTPSHVNRKSAAPPASSTHLSPLRRSSKLAPTLKNLL